MSLGSWVTSVSPSVLKITHVWNVHICEWIKKLLIFSPLFYISRGPGLLSHFLSITILVRWLSMVYVRKNKAQWAWLAEVLLFHGRLNSRQCLLTLHPLFSPHTYATLGPTRVSTSAPFCCIHVVFGQFRPYVTLWSKAAATFQQLTIVFSFDHDSRFLSKVQKIRPALNSQN